ncbi:hypothetical protein HWV62_45745, partial [Athelia sp. TMB]
MRDRMCRAASIRWVQKFDIYERGEDLTHQVCQHSTQAAQNKLAHEHDSFSTGVGVDPVESALDYTLTLLSGSDYVSVAGISAGKIALYTITDQTAKFDIDPFSGIQ